jgi:nitrate/nitrite transporter NarK
MLPSMCAEQMLSCVRSVSRPYLLWSLGLAFERKADAPSYYKQTKMEGSNEGFGEILSPSAAAAAVGMINAVGSVAGFAGPQLFGYLNTRTGSFLYGLALTMVCALAGGLLILCTPRTARALLR